MSIGQDEYSGHFEERAGSKADGDDGIVIPGSARPLGTERTDVNPNDEAGIDELPNNDADTPQDHDTNGLMEGVPDIDPDNAERDDAPDPR